MPTYNGGKNGAGISERIINEIPPHDEYIAPFAGLDAVARRKLPAKLNVFCDVDDVALIRLKDELVDWHLQHPRCLFVYRNCDGIGYLRQRFGLDTLDPPTCPKPSDETVEDWRREGWPVPFVYLDPPYPHSTRVKTKIYKQELTDDEHGELLRIAKLLPSFVAISSYPNDLYNSELSDWRRIEYTTATRGTSRREVLWLNYPRPLYLHDSRFVGATKRERERIRRRVRNKREELKRVDSHERQAILDHLQDLFAEIEFSRGSF